LTITLKIPDEVLDTIKLPKKQVEKELRRELAFILYEREIASMGSARKLAELTKYEFIEGLAERGIRRHYDEKELEEDMKYAEGS